MMARCEKCWGDAYKISYLTGKSQVDIYPELLEKRKNNICTPQEQAGDYWDKEKQCDKRDLEDKK